LNAIYIYLDIGRMGLLRLFGSDIKG
jgi:hypothetical protein